MFRAVSGGTAGDHLSAFRDEISQRRRVLVIDFNNPVDAEAADFPARRTPTAGTASFRA